MALIALVQLAPVSGDVDANVARASELVDDAVAGGAGLVVLPECALSAYATADSGAALPSDDERLLGLSRRAGPVPLVVGFLERAADDRPYSSMAWLEDGRVVGLHRKLFLSGGRWDESSRFAPGSTLAAFDTSLGRAALLVCNDAWHPVAPWLAARDGAELVVVSAASADPLAGERLDVAATWDDLLRATARLLQVGVVFVNRVGEEAGLCYSGGSRVVDPRGEERGRAGREEGVTLVELDPGSVAGARAEYDVAGDARLDLVAATLSRLLERG